MNKTDWLTLRQDVALVLTRLNEGKHSTADDWREIAAQLREAAALAETEALYRVEAETKRQR